MIDKLLLLWMLVVPMPPADAQVSIGIGLPHISIGINLPLYPDLEPIPGYPVYYAPRLDANYFFYDGMYWIYRDDNWYASSWYNGPWDLIGPAEVPLFILRVPVRYYRQPPMYFRAWYADSPPRWGEHWGHDWSQRRSGWDRWNRKSAPQPAPLPVYQREYAGDRYPGADRQRELRSKNYRYEPRDAEVRRHFQAQRVERESGSQERLQAAPRPEAGPPTRQAAPQRVERESKTEERLQAAPRPEAGPPTRQAAPQRVERESKAEGRLQAAPRPEAVPQTRQAAPQRQQREEVQRQSQEREKAQPRQQDSRGRSGDKDRERDGEREKGGDRNQDRGR